MRVNFSKLSVCLVLSCLLLGCTTGCAEKNSNVPYEAEQETLSESLDGNAAETGLDGSSGNSETPEDSLQTGSDQYWQITDSGEIEVEESQKEEDARYAKEVLGIELSGEYVIDYQVREEPIPKEIADLGNPCEGTIHAFPTKIIDALSRIEMEKDPELKEAVEYASNHIIQHLEEETGHTFCLQEIHYLADCWFEFGILNSDTQVQYELGISQCKKDDRISDQGYMMQYNGQKDSEKTLSYNRELVESLFPDASVWVQVPDTTQILISIINYSDTEIDRMEEQSKYVELWKKLREYNEGMHLTIFIRYVPKQYERVMHEKVTSIYSRDCFIGSVRMDTLMQQGEVIDYFYYDDFFQNTLDDYIANGIDAELPYWAVK